MIIEPVMTQGTPPERPAKAHSENLDTIIRAAKSGDLAAMECILKGTGERVAVLTAVGRTEAGEYLMSPFAVLFNGNPYEMLYPPDPDNDGQFLGAPKLTEDQLNALGDKLAEKLGLLDRGDVDTQGRVRWFTEDGEKTGLGLLRTLARYLSEIETQPDGSEFKV